MLKALATSVGLPEDSKIKVVIQYDDGEEVELKGRSAWKLFSTAEPTETIIIIPPPPAAPTMNPDAPSFSFTPTAKPFTPGGPAAPAPAPAATPAPAQGAVLYDQHLGTRISSTAAYTSFGVVLSHYYSCTPHKIC